ncbi:Yip1 family protein [Paenibacillus camelliae]|uniref:Yip1 family protein n=1 Tax=Paenibacillus camelliae TaxID=512410 RepID=UPI00203BEBF6|nr:Yip1 family protein [Paenibacillus camelliae]MCM3632116.1 YIP1 family protein [Paenibacillus camelliae]
MTKTENGMASNKRSMLKLTIAEKVKSTFSLDKNVAESGGEQQSAFSMKRLNPLRTLLHPFESFTAVKDEGKGSLVAAATIIIVFFLATIFKRQSTGYTFNMADLNALNIWIISAKTIVLYGLWVAANWAVATWMDGEGKAKQIAVVSAYAIIPYVVALIATTLLSNVLVMEEGMFLQYIIAVSVLWSALLIFIGMNIIHDYGALKTLQSIALTFVAIGITLFLAVLFYTLFNQVYLFFYTIYNELLFRL